MDFIRFCKVVIWFLNYMNEYEVHIVLFSSIVGIFFATFVVARTMWNGSTTTSIKFIWSHPLSMGSRILPTQNRLKDFLVKPKILFYQRLGPKFPKN